MRMNTSATWELARKQLRIFYNALCSWYSCQSDYIEDVETVLRMLLQLNNSQQPTVWHPSILPLFPDLPNRFHSASLWTSEQRLDRIKTSREKMAKCVVAMFDAANWLCEYADLPAKKTDSDDGVVREKSAFVSGSIERYAEATIAACNLCKDVVDMRIEQIQKLQYMLDYLKGDDSDVVLPPNTFDNDTQVVNIMLWKELPGVIDRKLLGPNNVSTLTLAGFKELLQNSEHINE